MRGAQIVTRRLHRPDPYHPRGRLGELAHNDPMATTAGLGVNTTAGTAADTVDAVPARVREIAAARAGLPFGIDGIVIKADLAADQQAADSGTRAPRWAIACNMPAVEKTTRLLEVQWNVGRTGIIAPAASWNPSRSTAPPSPTPPCFCREDPPL